MMQKLTTFSFLIALMFSMSLLTGCASEGGEKDADKMEQGVADKPTSKEEPKKVEPTPPPLPDEPGSIDASELVELIDEEPNLQILDVRTPEEVAGGKIKGAIVINFHDADFADQVKKGLDKSKPIAVYCKGGSRSAKAVGILGENGFDKTYNLAGGFTQWVADGNETAK